ncbi:hypothetical protein [Altericista sp. CCNU0014]|uniref:hypothetical protein n=1 Tax=Altericista sp. CCNU0014 TaxID=3082949 RepID=UPI00384CBF8E
MNLKSALALLTLALSSLSIVGCLPARATIPRLESARAIAVEPIIVAQDIQEKIAFRRQTLRTMRDEMVRVSDLVRAARYGEAQTTFESARRKWYTFGGTIRRIAPDSYARISPNISAVGRGLYNSSVPLSTLRANLQALIRDVNVAIPISDATD